MAVFKPPCSICFEMKPTVTKPKPRANGEPRENGEGPKAPDASEVLKLYRANLDEVRRWFRNATTPGITRGHVVLGEYFMGLCVEALDNALEGKAWSPGD